MTYSVLKSAAEAAPLMTTSDLWAATHSALCAGRWSDARALLYVLGQRTDNSDTLAHIQHYCLGVGEGRAILEASFGQLIQDRIDLVNSRAGSGR